MLGGGGDSVVCTLNLIDLLVLLSNVMGLYKSSKPIGFPTLYGKLPLHF